jgi:hypothetical protein
MMTYNFQVSRGAECIMISNKFFMEHANALTKRWVRLNVSVTVPLFKAHFHTCDICYERARFISSLNSYDIRTPQLNSNSLLRLRW